jgi:hypothetical protein
MTIERTTIDRAVLPTLLLDSVKAHCRVYHDRDDAIFLSYIGAAIGIAERKCNVSLNPAEYRLTANELGGECAPVVMGPRWGWLLPYNNVREFTVVQSFDAGALDISANFEVWSSDFGGSASSYLVPAVSKLMPSTAQITLSVGMEDLPSIAPEFVTLIMRLAASQYENREADSELWSDQFSEEIAALWRPFS